MRSRAPLFARSVREIQKLSRCLNFCFLSPFAGSEAFGEPLSEGADACGGIFPKSLLRKGKVAVFPSASSPSSSLSSIGRSSPVSLSMPIISLVIASSSSSEIPSFVIRSSTGFMPSSFAHLRQRPSLTEFSPSIFVTKMTAIFLLHLLHKVGCIVCYQSFLYIES